jgi:hypothetical protein
MTTAPTQGRRGQSSRQGTSVTVPAPCDELADASRVLAVLDGLCASDLEHLAAAKRMAERTDAERRTARLAELLDRPALGAYRSRGGLSCGRVGVKSS